MKCGGDDGVSEEEEALQWTKINVLIHSFSRYTVDELEEIISLSAQRWQSKEMTIETA